MTNHANTTTDMNRRKALKALAAATGAAGIAALPSRWSKPSMRVGAVPAHAQVSCGSLTFVAGTSGTFNCAARNFADNEFFVQISQATAGIELNLDVVINGSPTFNNNPAGNYFTDGSGIASTPAFDFDLNNFDTIVFTWTFVNPADGCADRVAGFTCFEV